MKKKPISFKNSFATTCLLMAWLPSAGLADWSGGYAGLSLGQSTSGEMSADDEGFTDVSTFETDPILSAFGGYQIQQGLIIYGGEIEIARQTNVDQRFDDGDELSFDASFIDLKARAGYDLGYSMVYGVLGYSQVNAEAAAGEDVDFDGASFGLGVDYQFNDQFTLGAEYLARRTTGTNDDGIDADVDFDTLAVRASFNF
ncbi:putative outer membrane protein [Yoonia maricola]|uniref:Putative outer membrane protein n=1 Tax=Yoonia maricola TaxID=420999 RepID=A0A2M8WMB8_9RHOB|nr:outer membrane beta-barrel protein [Yoonia maricola]PJI92043.1 putative outer membrane protein [Yoonia maricola]